MSRSISEQTNRPNTGTDLPDTQPILCVSAICISDAKLLLIRRGPGPAGGTWAPPGGRVELGETMAAAVVREVFEETGLEVACDGLIGWTEITNENHAVIFSFGTTPLVGDVSHLQAGGDAVEASWVSIDEVLSLNLSPGVSDFLADHEIVGLDGAVRISTFHI